MMDLPFKRLMLSSPLLLSLSSVCALLGLSFLVISILSDDWTEHKVSRSIIIAAMNRQPELSESLKDSVTHNPLYYSRSNGLFHICFPDDVPSGIGSYSKFGSICITNNDYFPDNIIRENFNDKQVERLYFMRTTVILYSIGLIFITFCFIIGFFGCWKRSTKYIMITAIMMIFSVLFLSAAMISWHYVLYLERNVLDIQPFYKAWEPILKQATKFSIGWSYLVSWIGIGFVLFAGIFMLCSHKAMKNEDEKAFESKHNAYMMANYYDKAAMVPYGYGTYSGYGGGAFPTTYYNTYVPQIPPPINNHYGYMTYGH
uniref:MARVEL domain-containing protein n=1 Tax=Strongyloides stercoralis TaxID=6248 RepID=A0A0K0E0V9_STRER